MNIAGKEQKWSTGAVPNHICVRVKQSVCIFRHDMIVPELELEGVVYQWISDNDYWNTKTGEVENIEGAFE